MTSRIVESARQAAAFVRSGETDLAIAIAEFKQALPGWWYRVGECSVSCDATVGPDRAYIPKRMLDAFDEGFDCDLRQPSTCAEALREATKIAVEAVKQFQEPSHD